MKHKLTIGITGLNAIDSPGPGVGIARCLREDDQFEIRLIGLAYETLEPGIYMHNLIDKSYQIPYPSAGTEQLFKRLSYIQSIEKMDMIIPSFDAELWIFIKLQEKLKGIGVSTYLPDIHQLEQINKLNLGDFAESNQIISPKCLKINSLDEWRDIRDEIEFPAVIKGKYYEAYIVYHEDQLINYYHKLNARWGLPVLLQEFIDGNEIVIAGMGDGSGKTMGAVPLRKLYVTDKGKGWAGVVVEDQAYLDMARRFNQITRWRGGFEIELKLTAEGELFLIEINPRFPAWIYVAAAAGQNMPLKMLKMVLGDHSPPFSEYDTGTMFVRYSWDHVTHINEFQKISTMGEL